MNIENIQIKHTRINKAVLFKGFIKECQIIYDMISIDIPFPSLNFHSNSIPNRILRKVNFSFDVFSSDRTECLKNYERLEVLKEFIKPHYVTDFPGTDLYLYDSANTSGLIDIQYNGFVLEDQEETIRTFITSFNYEINKDLGYYEHFHGKAGKILIPIGYNIKIEGRISENPIDNLNIVHYY